jgi:hypothetical protein
MAKSTFQESKKNLLFACSAEKLAIAPLAVPHVKNAAV